MPRYRRAYATRTGMIEQTPITVLRSQTRSMVVAMITNEAYNAMVAPTWPLG